MRMPTLLPAQDPEAAVNDDGLRPRSLPDFVTPLVITFDEAPHFERTLRQLTWASTIVVIDSFSTDATPDILRAYPQVEVYRQKFDSFGRAVAC